MGRYVMLGLGWAILVLCSTTAPDRSLAQSIGVVTPAPATCPTINAVSNTGIARIVGTGTTGLCTLGADATAGEFTDPDTAPPNFTFQLILPSAGNGNVVKVFARDASGTALPITSIGCLATGGTATVTGPNSTIGEVTVGRVLAARCHLYVFWENGDNDLSFAGALIRRNSAGTYFVSDPGILVGGGQFDGVLATSGTDSRLILERNGVTINDGDTDDLGVLTSGISVTLTYTVFNFGAHNAELTFVEASEGNLQNLDPGSVALNPPDPNLLNLDNPANSIGIPLIFVPVGASVQFTVTFTPSGSGDLLLRMLWSPDDQPMSWFITGSMATDDDPTKDRTERIIKNFIIRRADQIVANEPDLTKRLGRRAAPMQSLKDGPPLKLGGPVNISGEGTEHNNRLTFSSSLGQVLGSMSAAKRRRIGDTTAAINALGTQGKSQNKSGASRAMGDAMGLGFDLIPQPRPRLGLWAEGSWARVDDDTAKSDFGLLYVGADYRFRDGLVVGLIAQFDRTDEEDDANDYAIEGKGWMVGPYVVARLSANLIFDARAAWGKSNNEVSPYNTYTDDFDGQRKLLRGRLTGDFTFGGVHIAPHVGVIYFEEKQKAYTDSNGYTIAAQTVELGRLTFGPKFSTSFRRPDGTTIAPFVAINGIWDFKRTDQVDIDTGLAVTGSDKFRARTEAGLSIRLPQGVAITGEGFYDGIGADGYNAYGGSLKVGMPF
ncbi:MAG: autotransporter outer membrane beta-barrel domain-containing protein [Pseudomonadota bacterium]